jgi:hypothetical protein
MAGAASALLKAGLAVKLGHVRQATSFYIRDRTEQGRSTISGYVIGGAFYAAAGVFMIAALLVGAAALFRWVETSYGTYMAFGTTGASLVVLTAICAVIAASAMRPPRKNFPSLGSRLRVALRAGPGKSATAKAASVIASSRVPANNRDHIASARNTATAILRGPPTSKISAKVSDGSPLVQRAGLAAAVGLIGWALARRYGGSASVQPDRVRT